ncbi:MAG: hypothetical protein K8S98_12410 [Planctomycetes bacterium]|nr:hypothetical protein [Planctomycetota bacterium]
MQRAFVGVASILLAVAAFAASATAHGAVFPPVPAKPSPPGATPGAPTPGSPSKPATTPPGGPAVPGPAPARPSTPARPATPGPGSQFSTDPWSQDLASWRVWWRFNQDEFLELKSHLAGAGLSTGSDEFFLDGGKDPVDRRASGTSDIDARIVPTLLAALARDGSEDYASSAMIALARVGERPLADGSTPHANAIARLLLHSHQEVAETAALSLGIVGAASPRIVDLLAKVIADDRVGLRDVHHLAFQSPIPERTRAFAIYGLGLLGESSRDVFLRRWIVRVLHASLPRAVEERSRELTVAAVTALGLVPLDRANDGAPRTDEHAPQTLEEELDVLFALYVDPRAEDIVRANVPIALARLIERGRPDNAWRERIGKRLIADLTSTARGDVLIQRGVAQALGRIANASADPLDVDMRAALLSSLESRDILVRRFSLIALARAGSSTTDVAATAAGSDEVRSRLIAELERDKSGASSWAALALGVLERRLRSRGGVPASRSLAALLSAQELARTAEDRGATALALGLLGELAARDRLHAALTETRNPETQGDLALALGLLGDRTAIEPITEILARARYQPTLLQSAATGLGLLGDVHVVPALVDMLAHAETLASQGAVASALGLIGDSRSIGPLVELSLNADVTERSRAFALVALGIVGDRAALPWRASLARDFNYTAATSALVTPETASGVLDIL